MIIQLSQNLRQFKKNEIEMLQETLNIIITLIHYIENFALEKNLLVGVRMGTWDFQAKEFYEKLGYEVFGEIKDCPPDTIHYDLKKVFY